MVRYCSPGKDSCPPGGVFRRKEAFKALDKPQYYIMNADALPQVLHKVIEAKQGLTCGKYKSVNEATEAVGVSRSAFYKYRDALRPFYDTRADRIVTFLLLLEDLPGVLSQTLNTFADAGANIVTINQSIPVDGRASVTISARTGKMHSSMEALLELGRKIPGIVKLEILAGE